jgi:hypothetical protein
VNWGQVAVSGALGGFGGASIAARAGLTGMKATLVAGASSGGISGGIQGTYGYYSGAGPHTISGALGATAQGTVFGAATGGAGGAVGQKISQKVMATLTVRPEAGTVAIGRWMDGRVTPYANTQGYGYYTGTPSWIHDPMDALVQRIDANSAFRPALRNAMTSVDENFNRAWINTQINSGKKIVDIGVDLDSPFYQIERNAVKGYPGYSQDFQPNSDLRVLESLDQH